MLEWDGAFDPLLLVSLFKKNNNGNNLAYIYTGGMPKKT
jgi:hypothetical protein